MRIAVAEGQQFRLGKTGNSFTVSKQRPAPSPVWSFVARLVVPLLQFSRRESIGV